MQVTPRKKRRHISSSLLCFSSFLGVTQNIVMQTTRPVHTYLTPHRNPFSSFPKWLISPLSTQLADVYDIPLLVIKEDHLGEDNSSLLLQPVPGGTGRGRAGFLPPSASVSLLLPLSPPTFQSG